MAVIPTETTPAGSREGVVSGFERIPKFSMLVPELVSSVSVGLCPPPGNRLPLVKSWDPNNPPVTVVAGESVSICNVAFVSIHVPGQGSGVSTISIEE